MIGDNIPWIEKYRANNFLDIKGQDLAISKVKLFLRNFPVKKSLILHGSPGVGKTSLAYAIAFESDSEVLELNASDLRDKKKISEIIGPAIAQRSLFNKNKIILVDEVDGISARKDFGGLTELLGLIEKSAFPIIITANNIWDKKFNILRNKSEMIQLKDIDYKVIVDVLSDVSNKENLKVSSDILTSIAVKSNGDLRGALNDLQTISKSETINSFNEISQRNKEKTIFQALQYVFKNSKINEDMVEVYDDVNLTIDDVFLWVEENIPLEYQKEDLARAYEALSIADVFRGRIYRKQHWRFMVYEYFLLGAGIAASKSSVRSEFVNYKKPSRILKIWLNNQRIMKKRSICAKFSKNYHISNKKAMSDFMLLKTILKNKNVQKEMKLTQEEIDYINEVNQ